MIGIVECSAAHSADSIAAHSADSIAERSWMISIAKRSDERRADSKTLVFHDNGVGWRS